MPARNTVDALSLVNPYYGHERHERMFGDC